MPIQKELKEEVDILIKDVDESVIFLGHLFKNYLTKQEKVREAAKEVSHCILEIYKHFKNVSTHDTLPPVSLAEKMLSSLFKDTNMKSEEEKLIFLQFLKWLKGILILCISSTIELKEIKEELTILRADGKKLRDSRIKYQESFPEDKKTENIPSKVRKTINDLSKEDIEDVLKSENATVYLDWKK
jgi:hypothetical protein